MGKMVIYNKPNLKKCQVADCKGKLEEYTVSMTKNRTFYSRTCKKCLACGTLHMDFDTFQIMKGGK